MSLRDLPVEARPRERLIEKGAAALSPIELIAILLGSGTRERSALTLASELLTYFGSLERLSEAPLSELCALKGVGQAKAVQLQAAFQLAKLVAPVVAERPLIDTPEKAFAAVQQEMQLEKTEVFYVLLRDARRSLMHKELIAKGTLDQLVTHPREVFYSAIRHRAHSLIVAHNHPSGDPNPSIKDLEFTHLLRTSGQVIGIPLVDHLIVGREERFYSFRARGLLNLCGEY